MFNQLIDSLNKYNLLNPGQYGFRAGKSTSLAAIDETFMKQSPFIMITEFCLKRSLKRKCKKIVSLIRNVFLLKYTK